MNEDLASYPEFDFDTLRRARPDYAKLRYGAHPLQREIERLGYHVQAMTGVGGHYYVHVNDPNTVYPAPVD
jgi:hypothetical protein